MNSTDGREFERINFVMKIILLSFTVIIFAPFIYLLAMNNPDFAFRFISMCERLEEEAKSLDMPFE